MAIVTEFKVSEILKTRGLELVEISDVEFRCSSSYDLSSYVVIAGSIRDKKGIKRGFALLIHPKSYRTIFETEACTVTGEKI